MGGKKGPEQNRKYEKDRRDRFNNQFIELSKLLPDFNSSVIKVTKAEIIGRTIQYLQDTQSKNKKLEDEFENEKNKIDELQKRVTSLLQIVKELITLLHKSDVDFPTSLPLDDFVSFKEAYLECKRKLEENSENDSSKKKKLDTANPKSDLSEENNASKNDVTETETITISSTISASSKSTNITSGSPCDSSTITTSSGDNFISSVQASGTPADPPKSVTTTVMNLESPNVLRLDSNSLILPSANILTVSGLQNTVINPINNPQTLLVNKQITVPTFILMQNNNLIPVGSVPQVNLPQRSQKLIVPKQSVMSTKTTFINKKPIPAVCLYKPTSDKDTVVNKSANSLNVKRKKSKRSKGILVKYPKRRPPNKNKKLSENRKQKSKPAESSRSDLLGDKNYPLETCNRNEKNNTSENDTFTMENCYSMNENAYTESNDISKNYPCPDNIFDSTDNQNSGEFGSKGVQFIDFFDNGSTRSVENTTENAHSIDSAQYVNSSENGCGKMDKSGQQNPSIINNYNDLNSSFVDTGNFSNGNLNCTDINSSQSKESNELKNSDEKGSSNCPNESSNQVKNPNSAYHHLPTTCQVPNDSLLMKFIPDPSTPVGGHECDKNYPQMESSFGTTLIKDLGKSGSNSENELSKSKQSDKEITPLTIHCNMPENKSLSKELSLSLIDERKHYDNVSSFDEFSNDLFTSLQVPASGQNADSISPTAAFLLTFPLVSSCKNVDLLPEHEHEEDNGNTTPTTSATILQIGNLESPSTLLFTSSKFFGRDNQKSVPEKLNFSCSKTDDSIYSSTFCNNVLMSNDMSNVDSTRKEKIKDINKDSEARKQYIPTVRSDEYNCNNDSSFGQKNNCVNKNPEVAVSQNIPFYTPSCSGSAFPSYNIFTKYNDIPPVTAPYYSLGSQPFSVTKSSTVDPITDFNSWTVPSVYNQEIDASKEKTKRDKCTSTNSFRNTKSNDFSTNISTFGLSLNDISAPAVPERPKVDKIKKPVKQNNTRLVNWMTSPDLKNAPDTSHPSHSISDNFLLQKEDNFLNNPSIANVQNNPAFGNVSYSSGEYFLENQNYADSQNLNNCKVTFSSSNPTSYSWSPSKSSLPAISHLDTHNMMIPSTLPTLVGDLALSNSNTTGPMDKIFNNYDLLSKKYVPEVEKPVKRNGCKNFYKNDRIPSNEYTKSNSSQSSFLSVTQLVDDKDRASGDKFSSKNVAKSNNTTSTSKLGMMSSMDENCQFENDINRDKCNYLRGKENYDNILKPPENTDYSSKKTTYTNNPANTPCPGNSSKTDTTINQNSNIKSKSKDLKYNMNRCLTKENKKDSRPAISQLQQQKTPFNNYIAPPNIAAGCDNVALNKGVNPLSNKNSNYSAESLISSSNHQNSCSSQNYFPYDNTSNYANCSSNDYARRRIESNETESSLTNVGYYTNTNYVYPNNFQSFNNYGFSNQCYNNYPAQIQHTGLPKKPQKEDSYKQDSTDWYKESFPSHYNSIMTSDFDSHQNKTEKYRQSFSTNKYNVQKTSVNNSGVNNSKYYNYNATSLSNNSKNNCTSNSSYSFSQSIQQSSEATCLTPNYDMKSNRGSGIVNSSNAHPATSLTNFNLSAIFPEINDKHCNQNRVNTTGSEKKDTSYTNNKMNGIDEMNYNYLIQPPAENNPEAVSVYSSSSFQIQHFTDFGNRKSQK